MGLRMGMGVGAAGGQRNYILLSLSRKKPKYLPPSFAPRMEGRGPALPDRAGGGYILKNSHGGVF